MGSIGTSKPFTIVANAIDKNWTTFLQYITVQMTTASSLEWEHAGAESYGGLLWSQDANPREIFKAF